MSRPRIRTLKPDTWSDEKVGGRLSRDARLLFVTLITLADDEGRLRELHAAILGHGYPYDTDAPGLLAGWLEELIGAGLAQRYVVADQAYLTLPGFGRHQVINRPRPSDLPAPPQNGPLPRPPDGTRHGVITETSVSPHGTVTGGREGKGRERRPSPDPSHASVGGEAPAPGIAALTTPTTPAPRPWPLGSPRQRGTNPRRVGQLAAAAAAREHAEHAAGTLSAPGIADRRRWQQLRAALRAAVSESTFQLWVVRLELAAAAADGVLVLDAPADARAWLGSARITRLLEGCGDRVGVRARIATAAEHDGLTLERTPA